jgi:hypothetical protein
VTNREQYAPGPAGGAQVRKDGDRWTLILVRELRHSPEQVWQALTDPAQLREWAPFDADGSLSAAGSRVKLTTVGAPSPQVSETTVTRADAHKVLEYNWGGNDIRWELEPSGGGTRLTLWHDIDRRPSCGRSHRAGGRARRTPARRVAIDRDTGRDETSSPTRSVDQR